MKKRIFSIALAGTMILSGLVGCSGKKSDALVIGGIGPLTGENAQYGEAVRNGAQLAVDEINAAGGVGTNGMKLELNFQDDEGDSEKAVNAYNTLKDNGMQLLMGTVTSKPCIAVSEYTYSDNMFMLTPSGSAIDCTKYDNAFRVCFTDPTQGKSSAQYIGVNDLATKVAVIYDSSSDYSAGIYDAFVAEAKNQGIEIVITQAFTKDSKTDFSVQIQKVKESGAELVFLPIYYNEAALILQQASSAGVTAKVFGCDGLDGIINQLADDASLAEGVMLLTPFSVNSSDETTKKFVSAYKTAFSNELPNQFAADAYDAIYAIKAALEQAKVTDLEIDASELCDLLKIAMTKINIDGVTGEMAWTAAGERAKDPVPMKIVNGTYVAM